LEFSASYKKQPMNNFSYYNPTKIHFGRGAINQLSSELAATRKILLVYGGGSIKSNGVYESVTTQLNALDIETIEHPGVQGNPLLSHVRAGVELAKEHHVDLILAVGGGSVVDSAKAIALGAASDDDVWEFFAQRETPRKTLPVMAVLTLPATGSEMNGICVVTNEETDEKNALVVPGLLNPVASFLDPETTYTLSMTQTAYACTDILSHVMEGYLTTPVEHLPIQDRQIEGVMLAVKEAMSILQKDPKNYDARATFMWSATLAWSGICQTGLPGWGMPNHALEMPLSAVYDIAHGAGLSIIIPAWIRVAGEPHRHRILKFGRTILGIEAKTVADVADALIKYYQHIGAPVCYRDANIQPDIPRLTELAYTAFKNRGMTNYTREIIQAIYEAAAR
jgi:alcohol dehydrogenase YqhD (iron-dependent ADH family)